MSCETATEVVLKKGGTADLDLFIERDERASDLTGMTEALVKFKKADGTVLTKTYTLSEVTAISLSGGHLKVSLTVNEVNALLEGDKMTITAYLTIASKVYVVDFAKQLTVKKPGVS